MRNQGAPPQASELAELRTVVVRLRVPGDMLQLNAGDLILSRNEQVIVESPRGTTTATVLMEPELNRVSKNIPRVLRKMTDSDRQIAQRNESREREAFAFCRERIRALQQPMKLVDVELSHTGNRAVFYFTSNERVDFRALVKDLAKRFHTRIEMRQIGVRDAARHTGGTGVCGREICCSTWLPEFKPVSIRMAKDQGLALNHDKLSGVCGRLRCCLRYEQELYQEARRSLPRLGKRVITPQGEGRVRDLNVLEQRVVVQLDSGGSQTFSAQEVARPPTEEQKQRPPLESAGDSVVPNETRASAEGAAGGAPNQATRGKRGRRGRRRRGGQGKGRGESRGRTSVAKEKKPRQ